MPLKQCLGHQVVIMCYVLPGVVRGDVRGFSSPSIPFLFPLVR